MIQDSYNETYSTIENVFGSTPEASLIKHGNLIDPSHPVLDIGAGQGRNALYLAGAGFSVHAVDPSQTAVKQLETSAGEKELAITCQCCGFHELQTLESCYSGILVFGLIQILDKKGVDQLIQKIGELCCQNALVFVTAFGVQDPSYQHYQQQWQEIDRHLFTDNKDNYRFFLDANEILNLFKGFEVIHHWEGLGRKHRHGDNPVEQHAMIEAVLRYKC